MVELIQANSLSSIVSSSGVPVLVMFSTDWCKACTQMLVVLRKVSEHYGNDSRFCYIDLDMIGSCSKFREYNIHATPTTLLFRHGMLAARKVGVMTDNFLVRWMDIMLAAHGPVSKVPDYVWKDRYSLEEREHNTRESKHGQRRNR